MLQRTNKLLIGKDIGRDAQVVSGAAITTTIGSTGLAEGEVVVLDKNFQVLAPGSTIADSAIIYICEGTGDTYTYVNEAGTSYTSNRRLIMSDPIEGKLVKKYTGTAYAAKSEQTDSWVLTALTPVAGTEYLLRIVYKDMNEHPGQFTQTYRVVSADAVIDNLGAAVAAKVTAHSGARVTCTYTAGTDTLLLTGKPIPECTTGLSDLEEFRMVEFESYWLYVHPTTGYWTDAGGVLTRTEASYGSGTWELVRDKEKRALPYRGIHNFTAYPVISPDLRTEKSETYNMVVIEHDKSYISPDNQYVKQAPLTTEIAFAVPGTGNQQDAVLAQLNPWMASCPGAFDGISF